jgi:LysM repeat protein
MTRENKLALVIGFGLILFVGILVSDHFSAQRYDPVDVTRTAAAEGAAPVVLDPVVDEKKLAQSNLNLGGSGQTGLDGGTDVAIDATEPNGLPIEVAKGNEADGTPVRFHKVQKGDTYWSIAAKEYGDGSLAQKLSDYNKAVAPDAARLALNADLRIPPIEVLRPGAKPAAGTAVADGAKPEAKTTAVASATYTIQKGDTPYAIAKKRGIKVAELLNYNGIKDPSALKPGQTLKIPNKG